MFVRAFLVALGLIAVAPPALAQSGWPERPIRLYYGFPPGNDIVARMFADRLAEALGKPVVFENISGAAGNIAADKTAKAAPDGYSIGVLTGANITIGASLYKKLPYDPLKDLVPVSLIFSYPNLLVVNNSVPAKSVQELVAYIKAKPGELMYAHQGLGTTVHLSAELLKSMAGIEMPAVPYRGPSAVLTDLMTDRVAVAFLTPAPTMPLVREGKLRALAVTSATRAPFAPDIPTMKESGFPDFDVAPWFGLFVPAGTPPAIVERLNRETAKIMTSPDIQKRVLDVGQVARSSTPQELADMIRSEVPFWAKVIKDAGVPQVD